MSVSTCSSRRGVRRGEFFLYQGCDWSAREELALLEAIEHYGLGNWEDVSKLIGTRSPNEAYHHYEEAYVNSNIGDSTLEEEQFGYVIDETITDINSSPLSDKVPARCNGASPEEQSQMAYLPLRDDFELDHDNGAELDIADLSPFGDPGSQDFTTNKLEFDLKVAQVHMFRRRLQERQRRHDIVHDYSVVSEFLASKASNGIGSNAVSSGSQYSEKLKLLLKNDGVRNANEAPNDSNSRSDSPICLLQILSESETHRLLANLSSEEKLRAQIKCLQYFRSKGLKSLDECSQESTPEFIKPYSQELYKELVKSSRRKFSVETSPQKNCDNGHDLLSPLEEEFCSLHEISKNVFSTIKTNVIKRISDGLTFEEIKGRYRNQASAGFKVTNFLQEQGLVPE